MDLKHNTPKALLWTGRVLSTLITLLMLMDGVFKIIKPRFVVENTVKYGYPESSLYLMGAVCTLGAILYAVPRTAVLGAILLTAYLGGAVATHVRASESNWYFAMSFGVLAWLGLYLRDARLRSLVPLRRAIH